MTITEKIKWILNNENSVITTRSIYDHYENERDGQIWYENEYNDGITLFFTEDEKGNLIGAICLEETNTEIKLNDTHLEVIEEWLEEIEEEVENNKENSKRDALNYADVLQAMYN